MVKRKGFQYISGEPLVNMLTIFSLEDLMSIFEAGIPNDEPFVVQRDAIFPEDIIYNPSYTRSESRNTNRSNLQNER